MFIQPGFDAAADLHVLIAILQRHEVYAAEGRGRRVTPIGPEVGVEIRLPDLPTVGHDRPLALQPDPAFSSRRPSERHRTEYIVGVIEGYLLPQDLRLRFEDEARPSCGSMIGTAPSRDEMKPVPVVLRLANWVVAVPL